MAPVFSTPHRLIIQQFPSFRSRSQSTAGKCSELQLLPYSLGECRKFKTHCSTVIEMHTLSQAGAFKQKADSRKHGTNITSDALSVSNVVPISDNSNLLFVVLIMRCECELCVMTGWIVWFRTRKHTGALWWMCWTRGEQHSKYNELVQFKIMSNLKAIEFHILSL